MRSISESKPRDLCLGGGPGIDGISERENTVAPLACAERNGKRPNVTSRSGAGILFSKPPCVSTKNDGATETFKNITYASSLRSKLDYYHGRRTETSTNPCYPTMRTCKP